MVISEVGFDDVDARSPEQLPYPSIYINYLAFMSLHFISNSEETQIYLKADTIPTILPN